MIVKFIIYQFLDMKSDLPAEIVGISCCQSKIPRQ